MTDLPKEDRDLIERVLGFSADDWRDEFGMFSMADDDLAKLLAVARSEGPARALVVDEEMVERAIHAINTHVRPVPSGDLPALEDARRDLIRHALLAALGASQ